MVIVQMRHRTLSTKKSSQRCTDPLLSCRGFLLRVDDLLLMSNCEVLLTFYK
jgi:hypothetical protein